MGRRFGGGIAACLVAVGSCAVACGNSESSSGDANGGASANGGSSSGGSGGSGGDASGGSGGASGSGGGSSGGSGGAIGSGGSGGATGGSISTGGSAGSGGGTGCEGNRAQWSAVRPAVMVVVDRSASMFAPVNSWSPLGARLFPVLEAAASDFDFGFIAFTGLFSEECPTLVEQPPGTAVSEIQALYDSLGPTELGQSPGMAALVRAGEILAETPGSAPHILFISDGELDYCDDAYPYCPRDSMIWRLQSLHTAGIATTVVGLPYLDMNPDAQAAYTATFIRYANAGAGKPVTAPAAPMEIFTACYSASDPRPLSWTADLEESGQEPDMTNLDTVLGQYSAADGDAAPLRPETIDSDAFSTSLHAALAAMNTCRFELAGEGTVDTNQLDQASVTLGDSTIPQDDENGWTLLDDRHVELRGTACIQYRSASAGTLSLDFPCGG